MTRVLADTTCGLSQEDLAGTGIPVIPQIITFGEESYREGIDLTYPEFLARLRSGRELPKTAAPYPGDFIAALEPLVLAGESVICIHPSADVSGTVRSALTARDSFPDADIRVIDTRTVAGPLATLVLGANRLALAGAGADEVEGWVRHMMPRAHIYFVVDTLEYLQRGGRIGGAAALFGSLLQVKPILGFIGGRVEPVERERTRRRALTRLKEMVLEESATGTEAYLSVMHSAAPEEAAALAADLEAMLNASGTPIMNMVPAIVTHIGPGALAVGFFTRE